MTHGCQMNENDSEKIAGILENMQYVKTDSAEDADIFVINTCSIRENANNRFFGNLGNMKAVKARRPEMIIAVCGCMMQQDDVVNVLKIKYPYVDIVFGTHNIHEFGQYVSEYLQTRTPIYEIIPDTKEISEETPIKRQYRHKAYVSIMFGCDNFCTYCIVPYTRGREKSRDPKHILNEIRALSRDGCKEIMLLGQNVNSYGKGLDEKTNFADLLRQINEIDGIKRIRFMTSHPKDLSDELISAIAQCGHVCNNIHLPLQSGSDAILKAMNRHYTKAQYLSLIGNLKNQIPEITVSTDIIVGFPGETEYDFEQTLDVMRHVRYDSAFTFIFSPRRGTKAALLKNDLKPETIRNRFDRLLELQHEIMEEDSARYLNTVQEILVDGPSKTDSEMLCGRTASNKLVNFNGGCAQGDLVSVKIIKTTPFHLIGEITGAGSNA